MSSALACDLTLVLVSMLNICNVRPAVHATQSVHWVPASHTETKCQHVKRTSESQNLLVGVHNCSVCGDWPTQNIIGVVEVDNDDLVLFADFLPYTDEMVGFEGQCLSSASVNRQL